MISIVIGLLLVLAMMTLLINVSRNNSELNKTNRLIENGRFALQLLEADISHAGYWSGFVPQFDDLTTIGIPSDYPAAVPDPCLAHTTPWTPAHITNLIGVSVQGYEIASPVPSPTLSECASKVVSPKASTDVLVVRHVENCLPGVDGCAAFTEGDLYLQIERCGTTTPSPAYKLATYPADASTANTVFPLKQRAAAVSGVIPACTDASVGFEEKRKFISNIYYIRNYAVTAGDGIPTLMRSQFGTETIGGVSVLQHQAPQPLIEGVEGFRVEYGVDSLSDTGAAVNFAAAINWANPANKTSPTNRGDGIPDGAYVRCTTVLPCTVNQLANTVAVRIYVLVRTEQTTPGYIDRKTYNLGSTSLGPFDDAYKRHLFTQTIRLNNISTRRETP
jgi:type IV pilus assembly protein PilW